MWFYENYNKNTARAEKIFAFGNKCAIIDTTPLNRWATYASALPTNVKFAWPHLRVNQKLGLCPLKKLLRNAGVAMRIFTQRMVFS